MWSVYLLLSLLMCHTSQEAYLPKKMIGHDAGEECEGAKVEVRPAKEEWVDEFVVVGPHVRFHPIGDNLNR